MTREPYPCRQEAERLDTRRGMNDHEYFQWVYDLAHPGWRATPEEFEALVNYTPDQWAVWNA